MTIIQKIVAARLNSSLVLMVNKIEDKSVNVMTIPGLKQESVNKHQSKTLQNTTITMHY